MILTSNVLCERIIEENVQAQLFVSSDQGKSTQTFQEYPSFPFSLGRVSIIRPNIYFKI